MLKPTNDGVNVVFGASQGAYNGLAGKYVGAIKRHFAPTFFIPYFVCAWINGQRVGMRHILQNGDTLEFLGVFGVKAGDDDEPYEVHAARALVQFDSRLRQILESVMAMNLDVESSVCVALARVRKHFTETYGPINGDAIRILDAIGCDIRRVADTIAPTPPQMVGTKYIATKLGYTQAWVTEMARDGMLPTACIVKGTGNGKPWKFHRGEVDRWIERR